MSFLNLVVSAIGLVCLPVYCKGLTGIRQVGDEGIEPTLAEL